MKKKLTVVFTVSVLLIVMLNACTVKKENKEATPDITESIAATAVETVVPTPTETPAIKLDTVPWGEDEFTKLIPECKVGAVTQIDSGETMCVAVVEQVEDADVNGYMDSLEICGFKCVDESADLHTEGLTFAKEN